MNLTASFYSNESSKRHFEMMKFKKKARLQTSVLCLEKDYIIFEQRIVCAQRISQKKVDLKCGR